MVTELLKSSPILTVYGLAFNANDHQGRIDFKIDESVQSNPILVNVRHIRLETRRYACVSEQERRRRSRA